MVNEHILSSFDDDLHKLNKDLLKLAKLATEQFVNSIDNYSTQNIEEIDNLISKDKNLDASPRRRRRAAPTPCQWPRRWAAGWPRPPACARDPSTRPARHAPPPP